MSLLASFTARSASICFTLLAVLLAFAFPPAPLLALEPQSDAQALKKSSPGDHRSDKNRARDIYRHPEQTLKFFGLKPDMTVVEIWPGGGWYSDIIAPFVKERGKYYAAGRNKDTDNKRILASIKRYDAKLKARPDLFGGVIVTQLSQKKTEIAPPGSADMVLTFRNIHNWQKFGFEKPF